MLQSYERVPRLRVGGNAPRPSKRHGYDQHRPSVAGFFFVQAHSPARDRPLQMPVTPSASFSLTRRIRFDNEAGVLGVVPSAIGHAGGSMGAVDIVQSSDHQVVRDIAVDARSRDHWEEIID